MLLFRGELLATSGRQSVLPRLAIVIGHAPFCLDPSLCFQPIKRRIKRTLLNAQNVFRHLLDPIGDRESVPRIVLERFQDQHFERSVNQIGFLSGHKISVT